MTRVCVFGNSHAGALTAGWRKVAADYPDLQLTFFAAPSGKMRGLKSSGAMLAPDNDDLAKIFEMTSDGKRSVDLSDFDALVFRRHGCGRISGQRDFPNAPTAEREDGQFQGGADLRRVPGRDHRVLFEPNRYVPNHAPSAENSCNTVLHRT